MSLALGVETQPYEESPRRTPLVAPAAALACGIWVAGLTGAAFAAWVIGGAISSLLVVGAGLVRVRGQALGLLMLGMVFTVGGSLYCLAGMRMEGGLGRFVGERVVIRGIVVFPPVPVSRRGPSLFPLSGIAVLKPESVAIPRTDAASRLAGARWRNSGERIQVRFSAQPGVRLPTYGDTVLLTGRLERPEGPRNPGEQDARVRLWAHGVAFVLDAGRSWVVTKGGAGSPLAGFVFWLRSRAHQVVEETLPKPEAATVKALVLGDRSSLDKHLAEDYRATGLAHVLSVSGMHVGFIAAGLHPVLQRLGLSPLLRAVSLIGFLTLYTAVTGMQAPVIRASVMSGAAALGNAWGRPVSGLNNLALALIFILVLWPHSLFDVGFQLSFLATLGILLLSKGLHSAFNRVVARLGIPSPGVRNSLAQGLALTMAAQAATVPPILIYFGSLSLISPLANILAAPLAGGAVWLGFLGVVAGLFSHTAAEVLNSATGAAVFLLNAAVERFAALQGSLSLIRPGPVGVAVYYASLLALLRLWPFQHLRPLPASRLALAVCLALSMSIRLPLSWGGLTVVFLDVGQGDGMVVHLPGGKVMVVDGGPRDDRRVLLSYLRYCGVRRVDYLVMTHGDADHAGGLLDVVRNMGVGEVWESRAAPESELYGELQAMIREKGVPVRRPVRGEVYTVAPNVDVEVLNPPLPLNRGTPSDVNNNSLVLRLRYGTVRFLLAADLEQEGEALLLASGVDPAADVLKVGHHGSDTSSSGMFLNRVRAGLAVIQVGRRNRYGMPSPAVLSRIGSQGATVRRTDWEGAVMVVTDGRKVSASSMRGGLMEWGQ